MRTDSGGRVERRTFGYDGGRRVSVSVPARPATAVVYAVDGQLTGTWGPALDAASAPPVLVVAVDRTDDPDEAARLREYSPGFAPDVFRAHEHFLVHEVRDWVRERFAPPETPGRTAVLGVSAGAEFALAAGMRHPEVFGVVLAASPGAGHRPPDPMPDARGLPRTYLVAGDAEPFFREVADRWADALRRAGADVRNEIRPGGHGDPFWGEEFPRMLGWAFGD